MAELEPDEKNAVFTSLSKQIFRDRFAPTSVRLASGTSDYGQKTAAVRFVSKRDILVTD